ncbi:MAG TPA: MMPL family transporter [Thermomicrobiales bacterium]|nr:MMPL family transporter [Thermomicrobiales bacterium]
MLSTITDFSSSPGGKWVVIVTWVILAAVLIPLAPALSDVTTNDSTTFLPDEAESTDVATLVEERFPSSTTPAILVFHNEDGLTEEQQGFAETLGEWAQSDEAPDNIDRNGIVSIFTTPQAAEGLVSEDGATMTMIIGVEGDANNDEFLDTIEAIRDRAEAAPEGVEVAVSGPGGLTLDLISVFSQIDTFLTLVTAGLVLVLLILIYRSPVIAFVPLFAVGWVFMIVAALAAVAADRFDVIVTGQAQGIMTVLLFGAGTDYTLFITSRFREELRRTEDKHEAMRVAMRGVGGAITSAAATVLVATLILIFAALRSTSSLGPLLSLAIAVMFIASVTLIPALITVLGRWAFWPSRPTYESAEARADRESSEGIWGRVASVVTRRPVAFLTASVVIFGLMSLGLFQYQVTYDSVTSLPAGTESREGFEYLRESFPAGESAPVEVYVVLEDGDSVYEHLESIEAMTWVLAEYEGVASVESAAAPLGTQGPIGVEQVAGAVEQVPEEIRQAIDEGSGERPEGAGGEVDPVLAEAIGVYASTRSYVSQDNGVALFSVILEESPYALEQIEGIDSFRKYARSAADEAGLAGDVLVGGESATNYDTKQANDRDTALIIPLVLITIGIILGFLLRSVIAPLYLLFTIAIGYTATLGISVLLFKYVFDYDGVGSLIPLYLFVFSAALGIDYSIYLMTRIREETEDRPLTSGVRVALSRTGGVITSAGIILAGTFSALMILPLRDLFQLGLAVAIGVLLDTFVTRTIMVPGIVLLLKRWNWWPSERFHRQEDAAPAGDRA